MLWSRLALGQQLARVKANGWLPFYEAAAKQYGFTTSLLLALTSRETNCRNILGDGGHGHGLGQIDDRSYPVFCSSPHWHDPQVNLVMTASVLAEKIRQISPAIHIPEDRLQVGLAAYNCGAMNAVNSYVAGVVDRRTTGGDYSKDVLARERVFAELLQPRAAPS